MTSPRFGPAAVVAAFLLGGLLWHSSFPFLLGVDGFYHLAQTRLLLEEGLGAAMPWMRFSVFENGWVDHHLGYHVALVPFVAWPGGIVGGKLAAGLFAGAAVGALFLALRALRVPHPALLALVPIAASWGFVFRLGMVRAISLSTVLLCAGLVLAIRGRDRALFFVAAAYAFSYHLSALVLPIALGAWLARRLFGADAGDDGPTWRTPAAAAAGFAAGFTIHPHFPRTWEFFFQHVVIGSAASTEATATGAGASGHGTEWVGAGLGDAWMQGFVWVAVAVVGGVLLARRARARRGVRWDTLLVTGGALVAVALSVASVRFVELSMPLVTVAAGLLLRDGVGDRRLPRRALIAATVVVLLAAGFTLRRATRNGDLDPYRFELAGEWLRANVPPGELVYNFRWGDWPELVFHAPEQVYVFGLDSSFLARAHPDKYRHHHAVRTGLYGNVADAVKHEFGARWLITGLPEPGVVAFLDRDSGLERALVTNDFAIYRVRD